MKEFSIKDLKSTKMEDIIRCIWAIADSKDGFPDEEQRKAFEDREKADHRLYRSLESIKHLNEVMAILEQFGENALSEQYEALWEAFEACDNQDWIKSRSAMEVFLVYQTKEKMSQMDLSNWEYRHIMRWYLIFEYTGLCNEPEETAGYIFYSKVLEEFYMRMPPDLGQELVDGLKDFNPELHGLIENSEAYDENGNKLVNLSDLAEGLGIEEKEINQKIEELGFAKHLLDADQVHKSQ